MGESFVQDAADRGYSADYDGDGEDVVFPRPTFNPNVALAKSEKSIDWVKEALWRHFEDPEHFLYIDFNDVRYCSDGEYPACAFEGLKMGESKCEYLEVRFAETPERAEDICISMNDFLSALRDVDFPVQLCRNDEWVVWDKHYDTPRVLPSMLPNCRLSSEGNIDAIKLEISDNHNFKPAIISTENIQELKPIDPIYFDHSSIINKSDFEKYSLVFLNKYGALKYLPLTQAVSHEWHPLSTRMGAFTLCNEGYVSFLNESFLRGNSYLMAKTISPRKFSFYRYRKSSSLFETYFDRISLHNSLRFPLGRLDIESISHAISKKFSGEENILITDGRHPCDVLECRHDYTRVLITTPKFYSNAIKTLLNAGYPMTWND